MLTTVLGQVQVLSQLYKDKYKYYHNCTRTSKSILTTIQGQGQVLSNCTRLSTSILTTVLGKGQVFSQLYKDKYSQKYIKKSTSILTTVLGQAHAC